MRIAVIFTAHTLWRATLFPQRILLKIRADKQKKKKKKKKKISLLFPPFSFFFFSFSLFFFACHSSGGAVCPPCLSKIHYKTTPSPFLYWFWLFFNLTFLHLFLVKLGDSGLDRFHFLYLCLLHVLLNSYTCGSYHAVQWNLVVKRSNIAQTYNNKLIFTGLRSLYYTLFYPDIYWEPWYNKLFVITIFHCT